MRYRILTTILCVFVCNVMMAQAIMVHTKNGVIRFPVTYVDSVSFDARIGETTFPKTVLLECYGGQKCTNTPITYSKIDELTHLYSDRFIAVNMHAGAFAMSGGSSTVGLKSDDAQAYYDNLFGSQTSFPFGSFDRTNITDFFSWDTFVASQMDKETGTQIDMSVSFDRETRRVSVVYNVSSDLDNANILLWLTEDSIKANQVSGGMTVSDYTHNNVFRQAINGLWGESVTFNSGCYTGTAYFTLPDDFKVANCKVVALVSTGKEIAQAYKTKITYTPAPPKLSQTEVNVPREGGVYTVSITYDEPLYLEQHNAVPESTMTTEEYYSNIYDSTGSGGAVSKSLTSNVLTITVGKTTTKQSTTNRIPLYDNDGKKVATVTITQEGDPDAPTPKLGNNGESIVAGTMLTMAKAMSLTSLIANNYGNYEGALFNAPIPAYNSNISSMWSNYYNAINSMLYLDKADKERESAFGAPISLFNAIAYYNMVTMWGGVPYIKEVITDVSYDNITRTPEEEILNDLIRILENIIPQLEEKRNHYDTNISDIFYASKDVARILLADILMYQNKYAQALPYLTKVLENGYYSLDSSNDIIMGYIEQTTTRSSDGQNIVPLFTFSDVLLSISECEYKLGNDKKGWDYASAVAKAKAMFASEEVPETLLDYIASIRRTSMTTTVGLFPFLKRTGLAMQKLNILDFQLLLPIPSNFIMVNPSITQNPGY